MAAASSRFTSTHIDEAGSRPRHQVPSVWSCFLPVLAPTARIHTASEGPNSNRLVRRFQRLCAVIAVRPRAAAVMTVSLPSSTETARAGIGFFVQVSLLAGQNAAAYKFPRFCGSVPESLRNLFRRGLEPLLMSAERQSTITARVTFVKDALPERLFCRWDLNGSRRGH